MSVMTSSSERTQRINIFCMYALRKSSPVIDEQNFKFGDSFAQVTNGEEFLRRVNSVCQRAGVTLHWGLVEYVDLKTHRGRMGPFHKSSTFAYQSEFRVAITPGFGEPYPLMVDDLSDITAVGKTPTYAASQNP